MARGKEKEDGPSKNQLRGLQYNHNLPAFLRNAQTALSGGTGQRSSDGRPPIPTRPGNNNDSDEDDNKLDERDLGDEAPQVVVLNESRDLTAAEADLAKQNAPIHLADPKEPIAKRGASLRFNNNNEKTSSNNKRKIIGRSYEDDDNDGKDNMESFGDLVKRAKVDPNNAITMKDLPTSEVSKPVKKDNPIKGDMKEGSESTQQKEKKMLSKEEKAAMKAKRKSAKKLLSFED